MDLFIARAAVALHEAGEPFVLVSTLETAGSSPRHSGAAMIVKTDGSIAGTVGGGALEARAIRVGLEALEAQASRLMDYELTNADSAKLGMICGGRGRLLVEYLGPAGSGAADGGPAAGGPAAAESGSLAPLAALRDLLEAGGSGWLVTGLTVGAETGTKVNEATARRCLVGADGSVAGDAPLPIEDLRALAKMGGALGGLTAGDRPDVYVQAVGVPGTAFVFGAGHCGKSLVPVLGMVGFRTVIVDDRADFANADRFPDADQIVVPDSLHGVVEMLPVDTQSYIVIVTRGHAFDRSVLAQSLRTPAAYIGMIGSRKKIAETYAALREEGFTDEDFARVHAPIGVDIGAETPEEIAVSIAAEIIRVRHRGA